MAEGKKTYKVRISGRVQGVGFRYSTRQQAAKHGVVGYVRNMPDGTVEVVCQGEQKKLDRVLTWLRSGPPGAHVTNIETEEVKTKTSFPRFAIEH